MKALAERYCVCVSCQDRRCPRDCPYCSTEVPQCRCTQCPNGPCDPGCQHPNCSIQEAKQTETRMDHRASTMRWNHVIHETRIHEFHLAAHERDTPFALVDPEGQRAHRTGRELEAMALRKWLRSPRQKPA